ncbi:MAG TPA: hypothetical protein VGC92_16980, partial [Phenylobacterium sp.]
PMTLKYNYYEVSLGREFTAQRALRDHVQQALGDHLVAVFAPSLGYATNQALVLTDDAATAGAVLKAPGVVSGQHHVLSATTRPTAAARPRTDGIYVHRWLTVEGGAVDEVVALSNQAWPGFERDFEAQVFGLFLADASPEDQRQGARRLLLMTHYRDFSVWEASRRPDPKTSEAFARREALTRVALPRACVAMPRS